MAAMRPTLWAERAARARGFRLVAGVDEAGRGCLAGPVAAAAVILPLDCCSLLARISGVRDSKLLTAPQRRRLSAEIEAIAVAVGVGISSSWEIDQLGIAWASRRAMARAVGALDVPPDWLLIDAFRLPEVPYPQQAIIKGDRLCVSIAAASVVAKAVRDEWMGLLDRAWPAYGFRAHKGYGTAAHHRALAEVGPCPIHRRTFAPVAALLGGENARFSSRDAPVATGQGPSAGAGRGRSLLPRP